MVLIAVFLIRNTIKMTILVRKDEIAIMRTVGAYNWYISLPFVLEGIFIGFWGALGPVLICIFGYTGLYHVMNGMFFSDMMSIFETISIRTLYFGRHSFDWNGCRNARKLFSR